MKRRTFLKLGSLAPFAASFNPFEAFADQKIRAGLIGSGWYGKTDLFRLLQVAPVEVTALCDVDSRMLEEAARKVAERQSSGNRPATYRDYEAMLTQSPLDVVIIATPDHWHARPMIAAVQEGIDVYLEKPISHDVVEGQAMLRAARTYDRTVQVNLERRSTPHLMEAKERVVDTGLLGEVGHVEICCYYHMRDTSTPPDIQPPTHLDWDRYTGPAPLRPYNEIIHPRGWRNFTEYSNGIIGDMGVHMLDMARWMLDLGWPRRVHSQGGIQVQTDAKANIADTQTATFDFDDVTMTWQHRTWGTPPDPDYPWAAFFYGDKGTLKASVHSYDFVPEGDGEPLHGDVVYELEEYPEDKTEEDLETHVAPAIRRHQLDFLRAIDEGTRPVADIEEGYISTTSCILANLSRRLGRALRWDPEAGRVEDDAEANRHLSRPYRDPWTHPTPETV
jgi:predicted dehydrogenase